MSRAPVGILLLSATGLLFAGGCGGVDTAQLLGLESLSNLARQPAADDDLPASQDRDGDGLADEQEDELGTHRADPDTDGDGFDDFAELITATDPLRANRTETEDGVPPAFDGLIEPGASEVFFRGGGAPFVAYLRLMGLVRSTTEIEIVWRELDREETLAEATTTVIFEPNAQWCWGHDLGGSAVVIEPLPMTVNQLEVTVLTGDSVAFSMISSGGLGNGPRGLVPFPADIAGADLNLTLLMAHGLSDTAATWDSFAFLAGRISEDLRIIRTDIDPLGPVAKRAGALARFVLREEPERVYAIGHSMGGLDLRYLLTKAAEGDEAFVEAGAAIEALYTIGTPHDGAFLAAVAEVVPAFTNLIDLTAPAVIDLEPGSDVLDYLNDSFDGDITLGERIVPVIAMAFAAGEPLFPASDGVVELASQAFGAHVVRDVPSTRGAGLGAGRHISLVPTRADPELYNYEVLGWILSDIVARERARPEPREAPVLPHADSPVERPADFSAAARRL
ncbi:MAG: hypothetical protein GY778_24310 [bacterium]|nr:hypothetical protein [bacterium]